MLGSPDRADGIHPRPGGQRHLEASPVLSDMFSLTAQSRMGPQTLEGRLGLSGSGDVIPLLSLPFHPQGVPAEGP